MDGLVQAPFRMLGISLISLFILFLSSLTCDAYEGRATSKDGNIVVTYKIEEGFKINIRIDTKRKKSAYLKISEGDVFEIKVDFVDANRDGLHDVIVKYEDETGYSPAVLINHDERFFTDSLSDFKKKAALYINTELEIKEGGSGSRGKDYELKDLTGDNMPELIFYKVFIGDKGYRYAAFRYDKRTASYMLYQKGELFEEH